MPALSAPTVSLSPSENPWRKAQGQAVEHKAGPFSQAPATTPREPAPSAELVEGFAPIDPFDPLEAGPVPTVREDDLESAAALDAFTDGMLAGGQQDATDVLSDTMVELDVGFGQLSLSGRQCANLIEGQVLALPLRAPFTVYLTSGANRLAEGQLMNLDGQIGVQLTRVLDPA